MADGAPVAMLQGKRVALVGGADAEPVATALREAGATVEQLGADASTDARWHSVTYAALVVVDAPAAAQEDRVVQLIREFLLADKPVAVHGAAVALLLTSGGVAGRTIAAEPSMRHMLSAAGAMDARDALHDDGGVITASGAVALSDFARHVVWRVGERLQERRVDEMSDLSFPASDPPSITPSALGHAPEGDARG